MSVASDTVATALARLANDHRRSSVEYLNVSVRAGTRTPRRLMSDTGFLAECQFSYGNPHRSNFSYDDTEDPRVLKQVVIAGYGLLADYNRLTSANRSDRLVQNVSETGHGGVSPYPANTELLMSGALNSDTYSRQKTINVMHGMATTAGPAPHFIVNRKGDVIVGPGVDAETTFIAAYSNSGVFIAMESALLISRDDHHNQRYDRIMEHPPTPLQLTSLGVLVNKLLVALGSDFPREFSDALDPETTGFTYQWVRADLMPQLHPWNFRNPPLASVIPNSSLSYASTESVAFFEIVNSQGAFDLGTQIWRPMAAPTPVAGREDVRQALDSIDTAGEESAQIGNYVTLAAGDRSNEMQATTRRQMFVVRHRVAVADAAGAAEGAATASSAVDSAGLPTEIPANFAPHTYNFHTGQWGAPDPLTNSNTT